MNVRIKDIPVSDRPRERLINKGVSNLSNEELLSIIIKDGTKNASVKVVVNNILSKINKIQDLNNITYNELVSIKGIGISKACSLLSSIELGRRINSKVDTIVNKPFISTDIVYEYYNNKFNNTYQEMFYCIYLDSKNTIIKEQLLFMGTINYSMVHPREIFKEAYLCNAVSIICIHNHPSGSIEPSKKDIILTKQLIDIGNLLGIKILDHLIIGNDKYYSFLENGDI